MSRMKVFREIVAAPLGIAMSCRGVEPTSVHTCFTGMCTSMIVAHTLLTDFYAGVSDGGGPLHETGASAESDNLL